MSIKYINYGDYEKNDIMEKVVFEERQNICFVE